MAENSNYFEASINKRDVVLKRNAAQYDAILAKELESYTMSLAEKEKQEAALQTRIKRLKDLGRKKEAASLQSELNAVRSAILAAETELQQKKLDLKESATKKAELFEINSYHKLSAQKRREYHASIYSELKAKEDARKKEISSEQDNIKKLKESRASITDNSKQAEVDKKIAEAEKHLSELESDQKRQEIAKQNANKFSGLEIATSKESRKERNESNLAQVADASAKVQEKKAAVAKLEQKWQEENAALAKKIAAARKSGNKEELKTLLSEEKNRRALWEKQEEFINAQIELTDAEEEATKSRAKAVADSLGDAAITAASTFVKKTSDHITSNLDALYGQQGRMMGRLQGSDTEWDKSVDNVSKTVGLSGIVSQKNVISKMVELVDSGVAYNLELRAFLAETSQNIASTFDAANGTLLRMIRLQQSDTTAARLGMEATLTKLFNEYFKDSSYLVGTSDTVASAIMDASATLDKNQSLEFEFTVQKWLGSLYSLGMSEGAINQIASGINYLGTGNVAALSNNSSLQTLLAMSATRAGGKSYSEMLTKGLTSEDTNKLLKAMIEYLAEIAESQENRVTKAAYADLFGISLTDLSAFTSLEEGEILNIYNKKTDYNQLMDETVSQLKESRTRLNISQLIDTAIENAEVGAAQTIGSNVFTYATWKSLAILKDYVGEVKIPGVTGMGTGIASGLDLLNLAQTVMAGMGLVGSLMKGIGSMMSGGVTNFDNWNYDEYTQRGSTLSLLDQGVSESTSYSEKLGVGATSGSEVSDVSLESGKEKGLDAAGTTSEELEDQKEIPQKIYDAIAGDSNLTVLSLLQEIDTKLAPDRVFYTAISGVVSGSSSSSSTLSELSAQVEASKATAVQATATSSESSENPVSLNSTTTSVASAPTTDVSSSNPVSGSGGSSAADSTTDLSEVISAAVATAISNTLASYSFSGIPVNIVNGG